DARSQLPCFAAGTLVWTPSGPRAIEELQPNDVVLAYDFDSESPIPRHVLEVHKNRTMRFYHVQVNGVTIRATSLHRFWSISDGDWVETRNLRPRTELHLFSGEQALIEGVDVYEAPLAETYNLSVEENVTYFVG